MWEELGFVLGSKYRVAVVKVLQKGHQTPLAISQETQKGMSHVSRALRELADKGVVECMNPKSVKGRIYRLTKLGETLANELP